MRLLELLVLHIMGPSQVKPNQLSPLFLCTVLRAADTPDDAAIRLDHLELEHCVVFYQHLPALLAFCCFHDRPSAINCTFVFPRNTFRDG